MAKEVSADQMIKNLWNKVQNLKKAVSKAEKPDWKTSGAFRFNPDSMQGVFDIKTCTDTQRLIDSMAHVINRENGHKEASEILGMKGEFKYLGFSREEWENDLVTRAGQVDLARKKQLITKGEAKLRELLPEEERRKLEAAAVADDLKDLLEEE